MNLNKARMAVLLAGASMLLAPVIAHAQQAPAEPNSTAADTDVGVEDIVVTARKRVESAMSVPAVIAAFDGDELIRRGATDIYKIAEQTPQLLVSQAGGATGAIIALRGVATGPGNAADQSVSINIDGIATSNASALRIGQFDLERVEVLKGPQALFFGKNSPGGVLTFVSKGATDEADAYVRSGYEFVADQWRTEGAIGGPLGETVGVRVAGYYDFMEGYNRNPLPRDFAPGIAFGPRYKRTPHRTEYGGRATLEFEPSDDFKAVGKFALVRSEGSSSYAQSQLIACGIGVPQGPEQIPGRPVGECEANRIGTPNGDLSPAVRALVPAFDRDEEEINQQYVTSLSMDYNLSPELVLSSITGLYDYKLRGAGTLSGPRPVIVLATNIDKQDFSEELRLLSNFDGPIDFTLGFFYQDAELDYHPFLMLPPPTGLFNTPRYIIDGKTLSGFGQLSWEITDKLELAGGVRYTDETKDVAVSTRLGGDRTAFVSPNRVEVTDWSPEATLTFRPSEDLTLFGAFKEGFKSGGYVASITGGFATVQDISYGPERVRGGEVGVKARLLDRKLRVNAALFDYSYRDLQVAAFDPVRLSVVTTNAGSAKVKGAEFDFAYRPDEQLLLSGALAYTDAEYGSYITTCYAGQTISAGCNLRSNGARFTSQDLSGRRPSYSPAWAGNLNADYDLPVADGYRLRVGGGLRYQGSFNSDGAQQPEALSRKVTFVNSRLLFGPEDERWEIALIGRNLTNKLRPIQANDLSLTGTASGLATGTRGDTIAYLNRPREVMLQLTFRPF